jgi:hypothetical protein
MPEPRPAKTKMKVEMNSASAALSATGCVASSFVPNAILDIAILSPLRPSISFLCEVE